VEDSYFHPSFPSAEIHQDTLPTSSTPKSLFAKLPVSAKTTQVETGTSTSKSSLKELAIQTGVSQLSNFYILITCLLTLLVRVGWATYQSGRKNFSCSTH
jgi:hypothetical protein